MRVQQSIEIAAPPAKVWPFLIEPEKVLLWLTTFKRFEYTGPQRSGVGTPLYIEEDAGNGLAKMKFVIQHWEENERLGLKMVSGGSYPCYEQHMLLEPASTGSRLTYREDVVLPYGVIGRLIGLVAEGMSARTLRKMLLKLKALAEA